jgi:hypothetical protein
VPGSTRGLRATKYITISGPTTSWSASARSIANHRDSSLFIEDVGHDDAGAAEAETANTLHARLEHIVILCGENQNLDDHEIFVSYKMRWIPEGRA